ncbi:MAG: hypothetical protein SNG27_05890 [Rikenellaceae bacterium]
MSKAFVIKWVGPFRDVDEIISWEAKFNNDYDFHFYIIIGKVDRNIKRIDNYVGISDNNKGYIYNRIKSRSHKYERFKEDGREIWIGQYCNKDNRSYNREDIELCETLIISYWQPTLNEKKKRFFPNRDVVLVNRWYDNKKWSGDIQHIRKNKLHKAQQLSDLIIYDSALDSDAIYGAERVKRIKSYE